VHRLPDDHRTGGTILNDWSALRDRVGHLDRDVTDGYRTARRRQLDESTTVIAQRDPRELLDELASGWGLSWATIAKLVGVSSAAVRKWRRGESITGENRRAIARVVAFLDSAAQCLNPLSDAASWLEMPISDDTQYTVADVYHAGHVDILLDLATQQIGPHALLDHFDPGWRSKKDSRFVVEQAADGMPGIFEVEETP
jgi:uncharacterized protein (DUF2384 family)